MAFSTVWNLLGHIDLTIIKKKSLPLHPIVKKQLEVATRGIGSTKVFLKKSKPIAGYFGNIKKDYVKAFEDVGLGDFTFPEIGHCAVNSLRLANKSLSPKSKGYLLPSSSKRQGLYEKQNKNFFL